LIYNERLFEYLIGVIQGDGTVGTNTNRVRIFVNSKEEEYIKIIENVIYEVFKVTPNTINSNPGLKEIYIRSEEIRNLMRNYKNSSDSTWNLAHELKYPEEWLAGIWDTDGNINYRDNRGLELIFTQKANGNMRFVEENLNKLKIIQYGISETEDLRWKKKTKIKYLRIWYKYSEKFANKIPIKHPKKKAQIEKALEIGKFFDGYYSRGELRDLLRKIIKLNPGLSTMNISKKTEVSSHQISRDLNKLLKEGMIYKEENKDLWTLNSNLRIFKSGGDYYQ